MIKKIALTLFVLFTFVVYSANQRSDGNAATAVITNAAKTIAQVSTPSSPSSSSSSSTSPVYKDGTFTGKAEDAFYGYIQVKVTTSNGKLTDVVFLQYPNDQRTSVEINSQAMPLLKQQAIQAQSAQVDGVSGASDTSQAFIGSLTDALSQAKA